MRVGPWSRPYKQGLASLNKDGDGIRVATQAHLTYTFGLPLCILGHAVIVSLTAATQLPNLLGYCLASYPFIGRTKRRWLVPIAPSPSFEVDNSSTKPLERSLCKIGRNRTARATGRPFCWKTVRFRLGTMGHRGGNR